MMFLWCNNYSWIEDTWIWLRVFSLWVSDITEAILKGSKSSRRFAYHYCIILYWLYHSICATRTASHKQRYGCQWLHTFKIHPWFETTGKTIYSNLRIHAPCTFGSTNPADWCWSNISWPRSRTKDNPPPPWRRPGSSCGSTSGIVWCCIFILTR